MLIIVLADWKLYVSPNRVFTSKVRWFVMFPADVARVLSLATPTQVLMSLETGQPDQALTIDYVGVQVAALGEQIIDHRLDFSGGDVPIAEYPFLKKSSVRRDVTIIVGEADQTNE